MSLPDAVRNAWHLVALSRELKRRPVQRVVAGTPVALFRTEAGLAALLDRCPHRNYPLSKGRIVEGALECPYHGWRFAADGRCVAVPGCALPPGGNERLAAEPVRAVERHGGVFVRLGGDGPDAPELPPTLGDGGLDHFWWAQGVWNGRAFDAVENVMDPFHTNHIHHGFIRRRDRRLPVRLDVNSFERGIEMVIEQTEPDLGLMARVLERGRARSRTRFYPPTTVQARWEGAETLTLCVTAFFTPVDDRRFRPFACFSTPRGRAPGWVKQAAIRLFLAPVVAQDRRALAAQLEVIRRFNAPRYLQGPGDLLGGRVHRLYAGGTLEPGASTSQEAQL